MLLLFGVMIFSYIIGVFNQMMDNFRAMQADYEDEDELNKFFEVMKKFNSGRRLPPNYVTKVH